MLDVVVNDEPPESFAISNIHGVQISSRIIPAAGASHGGDWCEAFPTSDGVIAFSIGDISGHGIEKSRAMREVRQTIRDAALAGLNPAQTLAHANRFLHRREPDETATAVFALLNTRRRSMVYANAGHPPPLFAGPGSTVFLESWAADLPLGIDHAFMPLLRAVTVPAATLIVFYTDGVSEAERDSLKGSLRLRAAAQYARDSPELPTAKTIESMTLSPHVTFDDAAILTARTP